MRIAIQLRALQLLALAMIIATGADDGFGASVPGQGKDVPSQPQYVFRTNSRLVVVDVVALNGKGEPVTDLREEDFSILEDTKPQTLISVSLRQPESSNAARQREAEQRSSPNVVTNAPNYKDTGLKSVVLLDFLNSPVIDQSTMRAQLIRVLDKLTGQPVAIYVLSDKLRLIQDFNSDPEALKQAVAALKSKPSVQLDNAKGGHEAERYSPVFINALPAQALASLLNWEAQSTAFRTDVRLRITVDALDAIVHNLAAIPGRKNLIWVSQGFPFQIEPGSTVNAQDAATGKSLRINVPSTANSLLDSQVAIYPIDTRGLPGNDAYDPAGRGFDALGRPETEKGPNSTTSRIYNEQDSTHASMNELAERTGGRAFYNFNDIGPAILSTLKDGSTYYTLAYSPANKNWNGKFRRITVKINRSGVRLRHRTGYFALDPIAFTHESPQEQLHEFELALDPATPAATAMLFQAAVSSPTAASQGKMVVNLVVRAHDIAFEQNLGDNTQHASIECAVAAFSSKGELVKRAATRLDAALKPEIFTRVQEHGFPCRQELDLPPGDYLLRLGVRDNVTGKIGTAGKPLTIPDHHGSTVRKSEQP